MATRRLLPPSVRDTLLGIPSDTASLECNYVLADEDLELIGTRRRAANRLSLAVHVALLRHPGQGWLEDTNLPGPLLLWLAEQIAVPVSVLTAYGIRGATRTSHRQLAMRHLGLQPFVPRDDMATAIEGPRRVRKVASLPPSSPQNRACDVDRTRLKQTLYGSSIARSK